MVYGNRNQRVGCWWCFGGLVDRVFAIVDMMIDLDFVTGTVDFLEVFCETPNAQYTRLISLSLSLSPYFPSERPWALEEGWLCIRCGGRCIIGMARVRLPFQW